MATINTVEELVRARYPIIYTVSADESRFCAELCDLALRRKRALHVWSCTDGLIRPKHSNTFDLSDPDTYLANGDLDDPMGVLEHVSKLKEDCLIVLRDFHPYIGDPTITRKLRDLARQLKRGTYVKNLVLLSPIRVIPPDLELDVMTADIDLPTKQDLVEMVQSAFEDVPREVQKKFAGPDRLERIHRVAEAGRGLTRLEFDNVLALSLIRKRDFDVGVINAEKETIIRRSGILEFYQPKVDMDSVGGLGVLKAWLLKRRNAFGDEAKDYGLPNPKGVLIVGIPGTGKSLTAKVIGSSWKMPLLRLDMSNVFGSLVGESEANIRLVTKTAEAVAPCILWMDELEKGLAGAGGSGDNDSGVTKRVFGSFLTWLSEKDSPVFVVATANDVTALPPELLRKGRFDEIFFCDLPDVGARRDIFRIHIADRNRDPEGYDLQALAKLSDGYSGSEIAESVKSAMFDAFDEGQREFTTGDIARSLDPEKCPPLSKTMSEAIESLRDWANKRARRADADPDEGKARRGRFDLD